MTGLYCTWTSILVLFVLATSVWASSVVNQQQQQQQQHKMQQQQHQHQHPRKHNSHTNQACPGGFDIFGSYCLHFHDKSVTQPEAVEYCAALGATLTYPINDDDIEAWKTAVGDAINGYHDPWGGATQAADGEWTWVDGTQVWANMWATGAPYGVGPCTYVGWRTNNGPLYDFPCDSWRDVVCQVILEDTTTTELPETTNPTIPSETTIRTDSPTTTSGHELACYSCISCPDVDDTTHTEPKHEEQSCFTTLNDDNVMRGVSPEFHEDGDCQIINFTVFCFCNTQLCNN